MTPQQVYAANAALTKYTELLDEWRKSKKIGSVTVYYNGYPSGDIREEALQLALQNFITSHYHQRVLEQRQLLRSMGITVELPEDWKPC